MREDRAGARAVSDAEFGEMGAALQAALALFVGRPRAAARRARLLSTSVFPF